MKPSTNPLIARYQDVLPGNIKAWKEAIDMIEASWFHAIAYDNIVIREMHFRNCMWKMSELSAMYVNLVNTYEDVARQMQYEALKYEGQHPDYAEFCGELQELQLKWRKEMTSYFNPDRQENKG